MASTTALFYHHHTQTAYNPHQNQQQQQQQHDNIPLSTHEDNTPPAIHRCDTCGKTYKSSNCLFKHQWEHSTQWELISKFPLTKHQQVQMLEAASILVNMKTMSGKLF
ncbi:uncharacterized protein B0P05DRAFT_531546 [Gilbertella persicaria]|uniref:uncharacterized protein n=1 Tax=Gilbertella persicaria TaxID=101096 RepID=UPI0022209BE8|nr:uncharacterized protein B0P05DRAFT_531546 [Gilbertella persicaria]KAI8087588.1 hypothetical protein B0P05DRAFT_531546 [Gilbertella persicaria]